MIAWMRSRLIIILCAPTCGRLIIVYISAALTARNFSRPTELLMPGEHFDFRISAHCLLREDAAWYFQQALAITTIRRRWLSPFLRCFTRFTDGIASAWCAFDYLARIRRMPPGKAIWSRCRRRRCRSAASHASRRCHHARYVIDMLLIVSVWYAAMGFDTIIAAFSDSRLQQPGKFLRVILYASRIINFWI